MEQGEARMLRTRYLRWRVAGQTALLVLSIIAVKLIIATFALEFISLSPLFTSGVAGGVFVLGLIVAGSLAGHKEAERVPAESRPPSRTSTTTALPSSRSSPISTWIAWRTR